MTKEQILEKIQDILRDIFDDDELTVTETTCAADVEGWDSLQQISIIAAIEYEFKVKFSLTDMKNAENVGQLADVIAQRL